jgi:two-component system response regulator FixJ
MVQEDTLAGSEARSELGVAYVVARNKALGESAAALLREAAIGVVVLDSPTHLLERLEALAPGCIVSGPCLSAADGQLLLAELAERGCAFPVVVLIPAGDVEAAVKAMKAGAADVVALPLQPGVLVRAVQEALSSRRAGGLPDSVRLRLSRLTRRERQVLDAIVRGEGNKAIGHTLGISPRTVEVHRAKVMEKLSCRTLADVIRFAAEAGLLRP